MMSEDEPPRKLLHVIPSSSPASGARRFQVVSSSAYSSPQPAARSTQQYTLSNVGDTNRGSVTPAQQYRHSYVQSRGFASAPGGNKRTYEGTLSTSLMQPSPLMRPRYVANRSNEKSKGLRHFSSKVCEKVKEKGRTNYNEVADELVQEYFDSASPMTPHDAEKQQYDMKNIRRRVYDALNVLMAMNVIEKEKKEIRWVGLPTSSATECRRLEDEKNRRKERIQHKAEQLQELIIQMVAYKGLVERNRDMERQGGRPAPNSLLYLPYIVINTDKKTTIDCSISHDKTEYLFTFDQPFEIHDDIEVLKRLGLSHGLENGKLPENMKAKVRSFLPKALQNYVDEIADGKLAKMIRQNEEEKRQKQKAETQAKAVRYVTVPRPNIPIVQSTSPKPTRHIEIIERRGMGGAGHRLPPWHVRHPDPRAQSPSKVTYLAMSSAPSSTVRPVVATQQRVQYVGTDGTMEIQYKADGTVHVNQAQ